MLKTPFELYQLRCFIAVAEDLNFTRAAARLNMTQPPLSRQIRLLEEALGLALLERTNRTVRLTAAGVSLLASATDLLQRAEHAVLKAQQAARGEAGAVRMGFVPSAALEFVPRMVEALARDLPDVHFRPTEMMSYEIIEALRAGELDFGLTRSPGRNGATESIRLIREPLVLALPADHPLARAEQVTLSDLDGRAMIGYSTERGGFLRAVHDALFSAIGIAPTVAHEVSQTQTMLALVNQGLGVALVPRSAQAQQMANLTYREIDIPSRFGSELYLCFTPRRDSAMHRRVQEVILAAFEGHG
ncbi:LysR family transcriptional regulator [Tropicibacter sp. S64]|uniref:LysR family transcriptional regulator n=1 Tax=Tropicibacter sp. S64 TaxID=3415122 RepID=UPI003C7D5394